MAHRTPIRPSLPKDLLEKIDEETSKNGRAGIRKHHSLSRKDARKQERLGRKQRKASFFSAAAQGIKRSAGEHADSPERKKARVARAEETPVISVRAGKRENGQSATLEEKAKTNKTALEKLAGRSSESRSTFAPTPNRGQKEIEEDSYIAYLEAKLGYGKGGGKGKKGEGDEDGLDDLLDFTSSIVVPTHQKDGDSSAVFDDEGSDSDFSAGDTKEEDDDSVDESMEEPANSIAEEWHGFEEASSRSDDAISHAHTIYDAATTRYIPPHLRERADKSEKKDSEALIKLTRQLKGLLNRMSEQNIGGILDSIEDVYRKNRRHDVTSTLTTLIIDGISSHSSLLDSYVVLYAAFVSSLHKIVGVEFAAYFLQTVVSSYERFRTALLEDTIPATALEPTQGKECSNLIVLLSELYNFQVVSCVLVSDIIRDLLAKRLTEFDVELLLKIVRNSGQQLRQDDPSALKDIIQIVQSKVSKGDGNLNSRTRFMIETLINLKNNKIKRNVTQNQGGEAVERMKKFLSGLSKKRHVMAHEPLRVSLVDLHSAESKGKWWLVGAAWGGDPLLDRQEYVKQDAKTGQSEESNESNVLLQLARKQGMNTDIRRSIFVVLMSSDDYVDACERLAQLNLTEVQQREIIRVVLHCCGNEKSYNPYYTLVCHHLCRTSHSYKVTLQFCLWDFLRDLGETSVGGTELIKNLKDDNYKFDVKNISSTRIKNVAKAYAWWIAKDCTTLAVLKLVDFSLVKPQTHVFLKELFTQLFISSQVSTPLIRNNPRDFPTTRNRGALEEIFIKATRIETLAMGLVYFLSEIFRDAGNDDNEESASKFL